MYRARTFGFKSHVSTVHIQLCTSANNRLQRPESKPAKKLRQYGRLWMKYCAKCQRETELNLGADFGLDFIFQYGHFSLQLLHFRAETSTLLNFGAKLTICIVHRFFP